MPHSSANPNRKRLPGRGDWLLSYLKSVSPPCPHAAALGSAGEVAKCPLCNPVASHCNPVAFLLCTHCNPAAFLLCTRCNCTACPQPCTPEKGDAKSRMQWFLLGFACPAVPGRSLQQEWGIDALPQALLLGAAREMKQHLITQHVGRLQSCQDNHAPVPWDTQPCSELSAEQQCGTAEPAYCKGHQECCNPCTSEALCNKQWVCPAAGRCPGRCPCSSPSTRCKMGLHVGGSAGSPTELPRSCSTALLPFPKPHISFFPPQLRAGVTASEWKGRRWQTMPADGLGGEGSSVVPRSTRPCPAAPGWGSAPGDGAGEGAQSCSPSAISCPRMPHMQQWGRGRAVGTAGRTIEDREGGKNPLRNFLQVSV